MKLFIYLFLWTGHITFPSFSLLQVSWWISFCCGGCFASVCRMLPGNILIYGCLYKNFSMNLKVFAQKISNFQLLCKINCFRFLTLLSPILSSFAFMQLIVSSKSTNLMFSSSRASKISFGPISWLMVSEIFPLRTRGKGISLAVLTNFGSNALVTFAFSPLKVKNLHDSLD